MLRLRLKRDDDVKAMVAACQDPEIPRYTHVPSPYGENEARDWLRVSEERRLAGTDLSLLVVDGEDRLLGSVGLHDIDPEEGRAEIGYWTAAEARRGGVATRAVRLLSVHAFASLPLKRIGIGVEVGNEGSRRVAERAGYTAEGVLRAWMTLKGRSIDVLMHSLLREEAERLPEPRP